MNILVINVSLRPQSPVKLFPVGLGYITTAMKNAGFNFDLIDIDLHRFSDQEVERLIRRKKYDVVCMGCIVTGYSIIKNLSSVIKEIHPHCTIIVGNTVASSIPDTLLTFTDIDIAVMGEGDETIVELLNTINKSEELDRVCGICFMKEGKLVKTSARPLISDISTLPYVDFSVFDIEPYIENGKTHVAEPLPIPREEIRRLPVNTARGCVASCTFCYHVFQGMKYRYRNMDSIIGEVGKMINQYGLNYISLSDELTFFSKRRSLEFSEAILKSGLHFYWTITCRANLFDSDDDIYIIEKMKEAGCISVTYSLESADPSILNAMNKHITVNQFAKQTSIFHKAGMPVFTSLVFGYPQETPDTIKKTIDCCIDNQIYPSSGYLLPQPGSDMYDYAVQNGFIEDVEEYLLKMGDRQDLRLNMTIMSDEEFEKRVTDGLKRCNRELNVGLSEEALIKTQYYRASKNIDFAMQNTAG